MSDELRFESSFLDDYFAEADEHLVSARRNLLALEGTLGGVASPAVLEELFRSFHSLKGISAMVELYEAEALAHHLEGCLRALRQGDATLTPVLFETLLSGGRSRRSGRRGTPPSGPCGRKTSSSRPSRTRSGPPSTPSWAGRGSCSAANRWIPNCCPVRCTSSSATPPRRRG